MVPNHLFQLLALVAMEPPSSLKAEAIRNAKQQVFDAIRPIMPENAVRGQYTAGTVAGRDIDAYRASPGVSPTSTTETYAALKIEIDTWRWAGVPFYLRTGKALSSNVTEIVVQFKQTPHPLFHTADGTPQAPNRFVYNIRPEKGRTCISTPSTPARKQWWKKWSPSSATRTPSGRSPMWAMKPCCMTACRATPRSSSAPIISRPAGGPWTRFCKPGAKPPLRRNFMRQAAPAPLEQMLFWPAMAAAGHRLASLKKIADLRTVFKNPHSRVLSWKPCRDRIFLMQVNAVFHHTLPSEKRKFLITGPRHANKKDGALWNVFPATKTKRD